MVFFIVRDRTDQQLLLAKQRSSILWLIAKANNNKVPDDLKEPYYKDHEDQDQLKPVIVHALASAECYCLALGNIYADPNYHRLNHWGVIQALARKGVYVAEPSDVALTETVLIQTSPIRMSAHMAVIEAIMALYIKETVTTERIVQAIKKFSSFSASSELPADTEEALVLWINKSCVKMKHRIEEELHAYDPEIHKDKKEPNTESNLKEVKDSEKKVGDESHSNAEDGKSGRYMDLSPPPIPILRDLSDLSDGCCLATVLSFYCPSNFKWQDICYSSPMTMSDSLYNLQLVQKFCRDHLPFNPCFLTLEDLVYQHSSVRQNILGFLSDLFFLLEIKPARCVQLHGPDETEEGQNSRTFLPLVGLAGSKRMFQQSSVSPIPDLRSSAYSSMPDINRISPKSAVSPQAVKEPMFPRRQVVSQPESRTLERAKRNSVHEGPRGQYGHSGINNKPATSPGDTNSMRRTHSLLEVCKTIPDQQADSRVKSREGDRTLNGENRYPTEADSEPDIYFVHRNRGFTPPVSNKVPDRIALDESDEIYSRVDNHLEEALPTTFKFDEEDGEVESRSPKKFEEEKLLPAKLKPAKEKTNLDSKVEERGEYDRKLSQSPQNIQNQGRPKVDSPRRYASEEGKENRLRSAPEQLTHTSYSADNVPKHSIKISQARVGESFSYPDKYSLETAKAAGIPIIQDGNFVPYEGFHDNRELEEQLANQNFSKTTLYVPGGDNKTQYIIIQSGDKGEEINDDIILENKEAINTTSFAQLSKLRDTQKGGINIVYMQHDRDHNFDANRHPLKSSFLQKKNSAEKKITSFASLPNTTTTWSQQQSASNTVSPSLDSGLETPSDGSSDAPLAAQVHNVRLKLEEKRRRIETEKRKMELTLNRARQKVGKAAFLQAVSRGKGSGRNTPDSGASGDLSSPTSGGGPSDEGPMSSSQGKSYTMEEIADNLNAVQNKWLESQISVDTLSASDSNRPSPDVDGVSFEEYTRSLERLNSNLSDLQTDIQRLSQQQVQMQRIVHNGMIPMSHGGEGYYVDGSHHPSRQQWEPPQRLMAEDQMRLPAQGGQRGHWAPTVVSVRPDVHASSAPVIQQRMGQQMSGTPFYMNQDNFMQQQQQQHQRQPQHHEGFSLHSQSQQSSQNGPPRDQFTSYAPYNMQPQQYGGQVSYHQQMPQHQSLQQQMPQHQPLQQQMPQHQPLQQHATEMYGHYAPQQQAVPFRLHVEGPPTSLSQQQPQMVYQKQGMTQSPPQRPTSIHTSAPRKAAPPPESYEPYEPQAVHFIESDQQDDRELEHGSLNSTESGLNTSTYRVRDSTSPNRPVIGRTFRVPNVSKGSSQILDRKERSPGPMSDDELSSSLSPPVRCAAGSDKGFFVAFDDDQPRKIKPPLRMKKTMRSTSRDEDGYVSTEADGDSVHVSTSNSRASSVERLEPRSKEQSPKPHRVENHRVKLQPDSGDPIASLAPVTVVDTPPVGFVIAETSGQPENDDEDEMAKKKERILLNALRRKEEQEFKRAKQELEGAQRREQERIKQEMSERKREEERARRQAILDQYKQRKAEESQEPLPSEVTKTSTLPKSRAKQPKQRPKSLHESALAGAESRSSNLNLASSGGRGSQQNLSSHSSDTSPYRGYSEVDVGIGRSTPPRRAPSPGQYVYRNPLSPGGGPPSLPPGLVGRRGGHVSDTASDTCSTTSLEYTGPKLFKQPTAKSNRGIIINAINTVLAGAVNQETKKRALEEIAQCDSKHFLILFRDSGCQFRALYSYYPERDEVFKLFGTGPKQVMQHMMDRYFKYNSGGKSFMEIQTKHLTVTIDAFTIQNTLWQGKKVTLPKKELY
uniref:CKK domain-containing protein n=1 Tax=Strigamia maritima TaxID=126957 RepID=T1JA50_STRMM